MSRNSTSRERRKPFRDATLIVIAAEGNRTEFAYFDSIGRKEWFFNPRLTVLPMYRDAQTTGSDPESLIRLMDKYRKDHRELGANDEFWIVVDRDPGNISAHQLARAKTLCDTKGYRLCLSARYGC